MKISAKETSPLKKYADLNIIPSANDCLIAFIYKSYIASIKNVKTDTEKNNSTSYPLELVVNARYRRSPPTPKFFYGNMVLVQGVYGYKIEEVEKLKLFDIAVEIRKIISKVDEEFFQSFVDTLSGMEFSQFTGMDGIFSEKLTSCETSIW